MGLNVSIIEIVNAANANPELKELLYFKVDEKLQPSEIDYQHYLSQERTFLRLSLEKSL